MESNKPLVSESFTHLIDINHVTSEEAIQEIQQATERVKVEAMDQGAIEGMVVVEVHISADPEGYIETCLYCTYERCATSKERRSMEREGS